MSIARKDDRRNADLVREIAEGFDRAVNAQGEGSGGSETADGEDRPRFVVTGDKRNEDRKRR
ncbi:hypothetical protein ACFS2C_20180 [Prauserella oleivorans]|uniref:Uncharacterized protein n=1 Tax=Prauserella oleivorans TaxID=1478153 RepID=A0ABW5WF23_9PSEU